MLLTFSWICTEDFLLECVRVCGCPRVRLRHRLTHQTRQANTTQLLHCKSGLCVCLCTALSLSFLLLLGVKQLDCRGSASVLSTLQRPSRVARKTICSKLHHSVDSTWRDAVFVCLRVCRFPWETRPGGGWAAGMPLAKTSVPVRPVTTPKRHWPFVRCLTLSQRNKWCNSGLMTWKRLTGSTPVEWDIKHRNPTTNLQSNGTRSVVRLGGSPSTARILFRAPFWKIWWWNVAANKEPWMSLKNLNALGSLMHLRTIPMVPISVVTILFFQTSILTLFRNKRRRWPSGAPPSDYGFQGRSRGSDQSVSLLIGRTLSRCSINTMEKFFL